MPCVSEQIQAVHGSRCAMWASFAAGHLAVLWSVYVLNGAVFILYRNRRSGGSADVTVRKVANIAVSWVCTTSVSGVQVRVFAVMLVPGHL